jgi:hypothetical protein
MNVNTDLFIKNEELDDLKFDVRSYSSFIAFGVKQGYRSIVDFHLDTRTYDFETSEMVDDPSGLEWLRGQLQSCIHQLDDLIDPKRGAELEAGELDQHDPEFTEDEDDPTA